jgi:hypothetical protein
VNRRRVARYALQAHPTAARAALGGEMLDTLLEASGGSRRRFAREIVDLIHTGLRARATQTASRGAGRLIADGLCLAAIWVMTLDLATLLSQRVRGMHDPLLAWPSIALLGALLALALLGFDRLAGAGALAWTALRLPDLIDHHSGITALAPEALPIICFAVMLLAPRRRTPDPRRLAWLIVPAVLVLSFGPRNNDQNAILIAGILLTVILVIAFAVSMLPTDPRLAIAGAVPLSTVAISVVSINHDTSALAWLFVAAAPAVLIVAITRTRRLQRLTPI